MEVHRHAIALAGIEIAPEEEHVGHAHAADQADIPVALGNSCSLRCRVHIVQFHRNAYHGQVALNQLGNLRVLAHVVGQQRDGHAVSITRFRQLGLSRLGIVGDGAGPRLVVIDGGGHAVVGHHSAMAGIDTVNQPLRVNGVADRLTQRQVIAYQIVVHIEAQAIVGAVGDIVAVNSVHRVRLTGDAHIHLTSELDIAALDGNRHLRGSLT